MSRVIRAGLAVLLWCVGVTAHAEDFYLAVSTGSGTEASPRKSGCAPGASAIDLRHKTGKDLWICRSANMIGATGAISLSKTTEETLSAKVRTDTVTALGKSISVTSTTVPELLKELLVDSGGIIPDRDGVLKIYLGGKLPIYQRTAWAPFEDRGLLANLQNGYLRQAERLEYVLLGTETAYATVLTTETFNVADNATLTGAVHTWTEFTGTGWRTNTNAANSNVATRSEARNESTLATVNHQVSATLTAHTRTGGAFARCGVIGRKDNTATATYYSFFSDIAATGSEIQKRVAGTPTSLGTDITDITPGTAVLLLDISGSSLTGKVDGATRVGPITDTEISGNTYTGIYSHSDGSAHNCTLDNFNAQDNSANAGQYRRRAG